MTQDQYSGDLTRGPRPPSRTLRNISIFVLVWVFLFGVFYYSTAGREDLPWPRDFGPYERKTGDKGLFIFYCAEQRLVLMNDGSGKAVTPRILLNCVKKTYQPMTALHSDNIAPRPGGKSAAEIYTIYDVHGRSRPKLAQAIRIKRVNLRTKVTFQPKPPADTCPWWEERVDCARVDIVYDLDLEKAAPAFQQLVRECREAGEKKCKGTVGELSIDHHYILSAGGSGRIIFNVPIVLR